MSAGPSRRLRAGAVFTVLTAMAAGQPVRAAVDHTRPVARPPTQAVVTGSTLGSQTIPLRVRWSAATDAAPSSGIDLYQVQQRTKAGGSWGRWHTVRRSAARAFTRNTVTGTHQFRVRASDRAGNWSTWRTGLPLKLRSAEGGGHVAFGGQWRIQRSAVFYHGSTRYATGAGSSASHTFVGRDVAWVAVRGPDRGRARVYVDGRRVTIIDLYAPARQARRTVFARKWADTGAHSIKIVVGNPDSRSSGSRVEMDSFVTLDVEEPAPPPAERHGLEVVAHRGDTNDADGFPENSLEAVSQAADRGADVVEIDVRWSADGTPWLSHDATVDRTTNGSGGVAELSDAELEALVVDGGYGYNAERHGMSIGLARLQDVLAALAESGSGIRFDDKSDRGDELVEFLAVHGWPLTPDRSEVAVHRAGIASAVRSLGASVRIIAGEDLVYDPDLYDGWTVDYRDASAELFTELGGFAGFYSRIANRDDSERVRDAVAWGVNAITVNDLPAALALRDALGGDGP
ncbi:MAG TPA: glycerophosphodiester phosphodiesterase family protein [Candidatus Limnocylindria bacterium]